VRAIPKHSEDTTGSHVEGSTSTSLDVGEGATSIVTGRALALSRDNVSEETLVRRAVCTLVLGFDVWVRPTDTLGTSMESVLVELVIVDEFDDIDLREESRIRMLGWKR
jgi:hypothetical protein